MAPAKKKKGGNNSSSSAGRSPAGGQRRPGAQPLFPGEAPAPGSGAASVPAVLEHLENLHESVRNHAYGFEGTLLFTNTVGLLVMLHTLYRARMPRWANSVVLATVCLLSRHLLMRFTRPIPGLPLGRQLVANKPLLAVCVAEAAVLGYALVSLQARHSMGAVLPFLFPCAASVALFGRLVPPLPDLRGDGGTPPGMLLSDLALSTVVFRSLETLWLVSAVPLLLNQQGYLFYASTSAARLYTILSLVSVVMLTAQTFVLNRVSLHVEAIALGLWQRPPKDAPEPDGAVEWTSAAPYPEGQVVAHNGVLYRAAAPRTAAEPGCRISASVHRLFIGEGGHPSTSAILNGLSAALLALLAAQLVLVAVSRYWVEYAAIMVPTAASLCLVAFTAHDHLTADFGQRKLRPGGE